MGDEIAKRMIERLNTMDYTSLKNKEKELLAQLHEVKEEIAKAEKDIINEKFNMVIKCLIEIDEMTGGYYNFTMEKYCGGCEDYADINFDLSEIITLLQQR